MTKKLYTTLRLLLGMFLVLGILDTGNTVVENCKQTYTTLNNNAAVALKRGRQPLEYVMLCCSKLIDSTQKHLS